MSTSPQPSGSNNSGAAAASGAGGGSNASGAAWEPVGDQSSGGNVPGTREAMPSQPSQDLSVAVEAHRASVISVLLFGLTVTAGLFTASALSCLLAMRHQATKLASPGTTTRAASGAFGERLAGPSRDLGASSSARLRAAATSSFFANPGNVDDNRR